MAGDVSNKFQVKLLPSQPNLILHRPVRVQRWFGVYLNVNLCEYQITLLDFINAS